MFQLFGVGALSLLFNNPFSHAVYVEPTNRDRCLPESRERSLFPRTSQNFVVRIARQNWLSHEIISEMATILLEEELNYIVESIWMAI